MMGRSKIIDRFLDSYIFQYWQGKRTLDSINSKTQRDIQSYMRNHFNRLQDDFNKLKIKQIEFIYAIGEIVKIADKELIVDSIVLMNDGDIVYLLEDENGIIYTRCEYEIEESNRG